MKILLLVVGYSHYMQKFCIICWHRIQVKNVGRKINQKNKIPISCELSSFFQFLSYTVDFHSKHLTGFFFANKAAQRDRDIEIERGGDRAAKSRNVKTYNVKLWLRRQTRQQTTLSYSNNNRLLIKLIS